MSRFAVILSGLIPLGTALGFSTARAEGPTMEQLQACDKLEIARQLDCFRLLANLPPVPPKTVATLQQSAPAAEATKPAQRAADSRLDFLWSAVPRSGSTRRDNLGVLSEYKQSYLIATYTHSPNNTPQSPTRSAPTREEGPYDTREGKFQLSFKSLFTGGDTHSLWLAYSQQSQWQVFDGEHSRPFHASVYEPEVIYSYRIPDAWRKPILGLTPRMLNLGVVHQSNGEARPLSRSWNRVYAMFGAERVIDAQSSFAVQLRPWIRIRERGSDDDNPDLSKYLGYGDLELRYWWSQQSSASVLLRKRSLQFDLAFPFGVPRWFDCKLLQWHFQYFNGYGENLNDYNQRHQTIGVGVSIPFPDSLAENTCSRIR